MNEKVQKYLTTVPALSKGIMTRAFAKEGPKSNVIRAKCLDCCHFDRNEITNCTTFTCPLHVWRPYQKEVK